MNEFLFSFSLMLFSTTLNVPSEHSLTARHVCTCLFCCFTKIIVKEKRRIVEKRPKDFFSSANDRIFYFLLYLAMFFHFFLFFSFWHDFFWLSRRFTIIYFFVSLTWHKLEILDILSRTFSLTEDISFYGIFPFKVS